MRRIWTVAASVAAAFALTGVSGVASAAEYPLTGLPELGRCVKVSGAKSIYVGKGCVKVSPTSVGAYEWEPGPGAKGTFEAGLIGEAFLETVGKTKVTCGPSEIRGQWLDGKKASVTLEFHGCLDQKGRACTTPEAGPQKESEIKTAEPLEGELGFISGKGTKKPKVGIDLKSKSALPMLTFICQKAPIDPEPTTWNVEGSLIGELKPNSKMVVEAKAVFRAIAGKQIPQKFEEGLPDFPIAKYGFPTPSTTENAGLTLKDEPKRNWIFVENGERLEIKAK